MKNKIMLMLVLVTICVFPIPAQASLQGCNNTAIGIGAFFLGALLSNIFREPEPRYVERETIVVPQRTVIYHEPIRCFHHNRVYQPVHVHHGRVVYYQY